MALRALLLLALASAARAASAIFYYNTRSGESSWSRPAEMPLYDGAQQPYWVVDGEATRAPPTDWAWVRGERDGRAFWHNSVTRESTWEQPVAAAWTVRDAQAHYYVNTVTGETTRERPAALGHEDVERNATYFVDPATREVTWEAPPEASWRETVDPETQRPYFHNERSGEVSWEPPADSNVAWQKWHDEADEDF